MNPNQTKLNNVISEIYASKPLSGILYGLIKIDPLDLDMHNLALHGRMMKVAMEGVDLPLSTALNNLIITIEMGDVEYPTEIMDFIRARAAGVSWGMCQDTLRYIKHDVYVNGAGINSTMDEVVILRGIATLLEDFQYDVSPTSMEPKISKLIEKIYQ